ncbi:MAG: AAA family ATPase [Planctomycetaceae bacterium]|jgi:chromosomal replication initiator protein|nr:AAA family ATPase [Planctomycetaceae bacterium]
MLNNTLHNPILHSETAQRQETLPDDVRRLLVPALRTAERKNAAGINFFSRKGFIIGKENFLLEPVIQQIIDNAVPQENLPVLFYGAAGSGRTHLLQGLKSLSSRQALYFTSPDFLRRLRNASATCSNAVFRRQCIAAPLLIIDDLELAAGRASPQSVPQQNISLQNELRCILDERCKNGTLTLFAADAFPDRQYNPDFAERLAQGTTIPLFLPGFAVRKFFLSEAAVHFHLSLQEKALTEYAEKWTLSLPQLYAAVSELYLGGNAAGNGRQENRTERSREPALSLSEICKRTARHYGCRQADLKGPSRKKTIASARCIAVFLARNLSNSPLLEIADYFGKRNVSTIQHLIANVQKRFAADAALRSELFQLGLR